MRSFTQMWLGAALIGSTLLLGGCKREVPSNIVDSTMRKVFLTNLPYTSSAMCGQKVTGVSLNTVTVTAKGENLTGTAHVKGTATGPKGPLTCEGDVDFTYTTTTSSKKKGIGKKKKTTTTTTYWLSTVKLKAVQTPGVTFTPPPDEKPPEDDGDDLAPIGALRWGGRRSERPVAARFFLWCGGMDRRAERSGR